MRRLSREEGVYLSMRSSDKFAREIRWQEMIRASCETCDPEQAVRRLSVEMARKFRNIPIGRRYPTPEEFEAIAETDFAARAREFVSRNRLSFAELFLILGKAR